MTRTPRTTPLLSFSNIELRSVASVFNTIPYGDSDTPQKRWYEYLPLCGMYVIILEYDLQLNHL